MSLEQEYGTPRTLPPLGLGGLLVGEEELELVTQVLRNKTLNRYYMGPGGDAPEMVATLEDEFARWLGVRYCLGLTSCTAGLETALAALGIGPGDEVIVPGWSWRSCYTAVVRVGAMPVLAEVDASLCLDPAEIKRLTTPRTKAVIVVHFQGAGADIEAIVLQARQVGIAVVEDCAQSIGTTVNGRKVGSFGDIATFSFQHQKIITSGEGGMLATADPDLYERAVRFHDLGKYRARHETVKPATGREFAGGQFRMSELTGAVALAQFRKLPSIRRHCRGLYDQLLQVVHDLPQLTPRPQADPAGDLGFELYLYLDNGEQVAAMRTAMQQQGVHCGRLTQTYPHYKSEYCEDGTAWCEALAPARRFSQWPARGYTSEDFPQTEGYIERMVTLPISTLYSQADCEWITAALIRAADAIEG